MYKILLSCILFLSACVSIAGTIDENRSDSEYISYGNKHQCVVKLEGLYEKSDKEDNKEIYFYGSAVIFKPRWILTAAHVVQNAKKCRIINNNKKIPLSFVAHHALYKETNFGKYDIAIGYLEEEIKIDFYPELYDKRDEAGKICSIAGYGATGTFQTTKRKYDNIKRGGSNIIDSIDKDLLMCSLKNGPRTRLEFLICHGDSGGGLFIDKKLAGINSCILSSDKKLDADINDESGHTRISSFIDWIQDTMKAVEIAGASSDH